LNKQVLEKKHRKEVEGVQIGNTNGRTWVRAFDRNYGSRELAIGTYKDKYRNTLLSNARKMVAQMKVKSGSTNPNFEEEEMAKYNLKIKDIMRKRKVLSMDEIVFIFNFLLEMCKNAQFMEHHAVSLGTHMINDFSEKTSDLFVFMLSDKNQEMTSELIALNFEMRSKKFIDEASSQLVAQDDEQIKDDLFGHLFTTVYEKIK
jgi:hypothetical protein